MSNLNDVQELPLSPEAPIIHSEAAASTNTADTGHPEALTSSSAQDFFKMSNLTDVQELPLSPQVPLIHSEAAASIKMPETVDPGAFTSTPAQADGLDEQVSFGRLDEPEDFNRSFSFHPARQPQSSDAHMSRGIITGPPQTPVMQNYTFAPAAPRTPVMQTHSFGTGPEPSPHHQFNQLPSAQHQLNHLPSTQQQLGQLPSAHQQLKQFSFGAQDVTPTHADSSAMGALSMTTPTKAGRGHRRTASEFVGGVGGDSRTGSATKVRHTSVDGVNLAGNPVTQPIQPFNYPSSGHGRKSSLAVTTPVNQPSSPEAPVIDLDAANDLSGQVSSSQDVETPRAARMGSTGLYVPLPSALSGSGTGRGQHGRNLSAGYTPTRRPPRVGFSARVDFIPRPLSTISSQSGSSMSTLRNHSMSASMSSITAHMPGSPLATPVRNNHQGNVASNSVSNNSNVPVRPRATSTVDVASPAAVNIGAGNVAQTRPKSAQAFAAFSKTAKTSPIKATQPAGVQSQSKSKRKGVWDSLLGRHSKSALPPHVNAQQLNATRMQEPAREAAAEPATELSNVAGPVELSYDFDNDPTMVLTDETLSTSAPAAPQVSWPKTPVKVVDDDSVIIDLDDALDLSGPSEYRTPKGKGFNSARKSMHSGHGGPAGGFMHHRAQSAPSSFVFDAELGRIVNDSSHSARSFAMEDVFEEEDDEPKATDGAPSLVVDNSATASATTSFDADRMNDGESSRGPSSPGTGRKPRFDDSAARRLQYNRNFTIGNSHYRKSSVSSQVLTGPSSYYAGSATSEDLPQVLTPELVQDVTQGSELGTLKQKDSAISRTPQSATDSSMSSPATSPHVASQPLLQKQHRGSSTTSATAPSFLEFCARTPSVTFGAPGPELRNAEDISFAPITADHGTPRVVLQPLHPNNRLPAVRSVSSTMSLASAAPSTRRKRSSLGNLSRLVHGPFSDKSSVSLAPPTEAGSGVKGAKSTKRLSRVWNFLKTKTAA